MKSACRPWHLWIVFREGGGSRVLFLRGDYMKKDGLLKLFFGILSEELTSFMSYFQEPTESEKIDTIYRYIRRQQIKARIRTVFIILIL